MSGQGYNEVTRGICSYHMHANIYKFPLAARLQA